MLDRAKTDMVLLPNLTGTVLQALVQDIGKPRHQEIIDYVRIYSYLKLHKIGYFKFLASILYQMGNG
jgi:hypothetical protein